MSSASAIRIQIESALARRIPSALTPAPKILRPVVSTGIPQLDELLAGGFPVGAITELIGPECSGKTSIALSFLAAITQAGKVGAWIDVSNALDPLSAAAAGIDLKRLLWARCGASEEPEQQPTRQFSLPGKISGSASSHERLARRRLWSAPAHGNQGTFGSRERVLETGDPSASSRGTARKHRC
jgi:recombination protein RecA